MNRQSIWAVVAGLLFIIIVTTLVDIALHVAGIYPPMGQAIDDTRAVLATGYRTVISIGGAWLTAKLAPAKPMKHAIMLGFAGTVLAFMGAVATWKLGLGPRWFPVLLVALAIPQCWVGAQIHARFPLRPGRPAPPHNNRSRGLMTHSAAKNPLHRTWDVISPQVRADREIRSSRVFDAPPERLFRAWSEPDRLAAWWGPKGFTNTFHEFDLRPGGAWRFVMHGPNGVDYPNESVFAEVRPAERIVFRHVSPPAFQMTVSFSEHGGGTLLEWRMLFETAKVCEQMKTLCGEANEQNFDRLAAQLALMPA